MGYPTTVLGVNWYKQGEIISEGDKYDFTSTYTLTVKNLEKFADNGNYTCTIISEAGEGYSAGQYQLETRWNPTGQPTIQPAKMTIAIGQDLTMNCGGDFDHGNPVIHYTIWTKQDDESFHRNVSGTTLIFKNVQTVRNEGHYQCQAGNIYDKTVPSRPNEVIVEAPVEIEYPASPQTKILRWDDEDFELTCIISGSNIGQYTWEKDGLPLKKQFYEYLSFKSMDYNSTYGQTKAQKSVLRKKIGEYELTCENVEYFNGNYTCHSQGSMAGQPTTAVSQPITVTTQYKALWAGHDTLVSAAVGDKNVTIFCNVCSNIKVDSFEWILMGVVSDMEFRIRVPGLR